MKKRRGRPDPDFLLDETLAIIDDKLREALDYWTSKRGDRIAPARRDIDARESKFFLPHLQLFDVVDGGRAIRARLIGTAIARLLPDDPTGRKFDDSSPRPVVHRALTAVRWVIAHRKPLRTYTARTALEEKTFLSHETLFLPLSSDGATIDMIAVVGVFTPPADA